MRYLVFADKYQKGAKKSGAGMASLSRELPAKISEKLKESIITIAEDAYRCCRLGGVVRIDFMQDKSGIYITEINSIPGSMSFYLWEARGEDFTHQISSSIEESIRMYRERVDKRLTYESDIVERFVGGQV